jgi:hypothetical protein
MYAAEAESYCNCNPLRALIALWILHFKLHSHNSAANMDHCNVIYFNLIELRISIIQHRWSIHVER